MGLLTCGRCGCTMTADRKKGKYTYYRCTGFHGRCGNAYIREERLADLLGASGFGAGHTREPHEDVTSFRPPVVAHHGAHRDRGGKARGRDRIEQHLAGAHLEVDSERRLGHLHRQLRAVVGFAELRERRLLVQDEDDEMFPRRVRGVPCHVATKCRPGRERRPRPARAGVAPGRRGITLEGRRTVAALRRSAPVASPRPRPRGRPPGTGGPSRRLGRLPGSENPG